MKRLTAAKLDALEAKAATASASTSNTIASVFGIVCPKDGLLRKIKYSYGEWVETGDDPNLFIPAKMEIALRAKTRFIIIIGGRGSGKSNNQADIDLVLAKDAGCKIMELREFQASMRDSVHSLLSLEVRRLSLDGFTVQNDSIFHASGGAFSFQGLARNPESVKSAAGFHRFVVEEAQFLSEKSLNVLTPTARNVAKVGLPSKFGGMKERFDEDTLRSVQLIFIGNPQSAEDPFSKRFITPYVEYLERDGVYIDELHTIVQMNADDNPWFEDSGLAGEREFAFNNFSRALYDHVWGGKFNDHIPDAIIMAEWFDACIDSHITLGWKPKGAKIVTHDPADSGDAKGICARHGSLITHLVAVIDGDVNSACDIATDTALAIGADKFVNDATGIGLSLRRQINDAFSAKRIEIEEFFGSGAVDDPDGIAENYIEQSTRQVTNKEFFANIRAQRYFKLAQRCYRTYRAVKHGEYTDPADMISFSSECSGLTQLRTELCRIPRKRGTGNGYQIASKQEMKKLGMKSPNLADCVMMSETDYNPVAVIDYSNIHIPSGASW